MGHSVFVDRDDDAILYIHQQQIHAITVFIDEALYGYISLERLIWSEWMPKLSKIRRMQLRYHH